MANSRSNCYMNIKECASTYNEKNKEATTNS